MHSCVQQTGVKGLSDAHIAGALLKNTEGLKADWKRPDLTVLYLIL